MAQDAAEGLYRLVDAAYEKRSVAISSNLHPAAFDELMPKTLATDLLTAPGTGFERAPVAVAQPTLRDWCDAVPSDAPAAALGSSSIWRGVAMEANDDATGCQSRDMNTLTVASLGRVEYIKDLPGFALVDAAGEAVASVGDYLNSLLASGASPGSVRSYALALLRWWRFLAAVEVGWERATRVEVRDFVLWMRFTATPTVGATTVARRRSSTGYAPATINHNLAVLRSFYADRMTIGAGPIVNPVPEAVGRGGQRADAHHNPMQPPERLRRAPLRQKMPARLPRSLPDHLFDALFAVMGSDRDRGLLAFYISTGARASELLGVTVELVDVGAQRIGVHRKGSGRLQWLPASPDAFVWLRFYQQHQPRPEGERALWLTRRAPHRPLSYPAIRRVLQRANATLGTHWTLHDLRHTAAYRMAEDPKLSLTDVQWVLGHAQLATTQIYLRPREDEVVARVLEHQRQRSSARPEAPAGPPSGGYHPDALRALFGEPSDGR